MPQELSQPRSYIIQNLLLLIFQAARDFIDQKAIQLDVIPRQIIEQKEHVVRIGVSEPLGQQCRQNDWIQVKVEILKQIQRRLSSYQKIMAKATNTTQTHNKVTGPRQPFDSFGESEQSPLWQTYATTAQLLHELTTLLGFTL